MLDNEALLVGSELDFTVRMPSELTQETDVRIRAHGRVVRVQTGAGNAPHRSGIAVIIEKYDIIEQELMSNSSRESAEPSSGQNLPG